jgi:dihydrofolate synthase/folylpolyglutamate synthase
VPADAVLLEVGLGGILDATNVIDRPAATAITRISYDHTHILGETIEEIAGEKAGIMKPGVPAILAWQKENAAQETITDRAFSIGAPLFQYGSDWSIEPKIDGLAYHDSQGTIDLPMPGLFGAHQMMNAGTAIAMLRHSAVFQKPDFSAGMKKVEWPGRLQQLVDGPLAASLPKGWELWLDGGHNDSGGEVLGHQAEAWAAEADPLPLTLIFGMLKTKNSIEFLRPLSAHSIGLQAIAIPDEPLSLTAQQAADAAMGLGMKAMTADNVLEAISHIVRSSSGRQRILICGSLYLAGKILSMSS